jgi:hypothetical protein
MNNDKKPNGSWGGKRAGAGKKPQYKEKTENMTFRVPISHKSKVRKMVNEYLQTLKIEIPKRPQEPEYGC